MKRRATDYLKKIEPRGMQSIIMMVFTVISVSIVLLMGILMYYRFAMSSRQKMIQNSQTIMSQTGEHIEDYLGGMRQVSNAIYYNVIKENDFGSSKSDIQDKMNLLYQSDPDNLVAVALYNRNGSLIAAEPVASQKENPDVTSQEWFVQALEEMENMHFSTPHIQNLFDDATNRYYWVISLSYAVEFTLDGEPQMGVLLVDMDYSNISQMMNHINSDGDGRYYYLCDGNGEIIYHPGQSQIYEGIRSENSQKDAEYKDGIYDEKFDGVERKVLIDTISYTGWKLVGVIPESTFYQGILPLRYFVAILMILMIMVLMFISRMVAKWLSHPVLRLNESVKAYETGKEPQIYVGGAQEIRQLGKSIRRSYEQIDTLMNKIVLEQNERRKSELDALQSQINPHFLYNTLESITWMVEGKRNDEAVTMISQLAKLFRISLAKGRTVISIREELQHAQSYMNIQKVRYKESFSIIYDVDEEVYGYCTVKLILQPILENAVNYGIRGMDEYGEIRVAGRREGKRIILSVTDNGMGMDAEMAELVLTDSNRVHKNGSGVGLVNVNNRIRLLFGEEYGLQIESEPDEGTTVSIRLPAIPYTEENRKLIEENKREQIQYGYESAGQRNEEE